MNEGIGQHTPEGKALHATEEDETDAQGPLNGFAQTEVDKEHTTDEYAAYSPHNGYATVMVTVFSAEMPQATLKQFT